jgi:hypothetical protein
MPNKNKFFFFLLPFEGTFTSVFIDKKSESNKMPGVEIKVFLTFLLVNGSVADPGCLSRIPDPDFYPSRIPDPKTGTKERGEKFIFLSYLFM